ncbi:MAG: nicotinate (nicotinamide) nucleotide adenylyltransferase [Bacteroidales bacterium]
MQKVGLYFGSFNPIHIGHLIIAEYLVENTDLEEIWFVISPCNPLKKKENLLDEHHRLYMVKLAIEDDFRFRACDIEFKLPYPSYTSYTLLCLSEKYPKKQFSLIMGEDNLENIEKWKNYDFILDHYRIYLYPRHGYDGGKYKQQSNVISVEAPKIEISATMIRESIKQKKSVKYLLPKTVEKHIDEMGFYQKK